MQQRLPSKFVRPILFAHRGARAHSRENTLESFELAVRLGATGLETDVWLTRDNQAVLDHDGLIKLRMRRRQIREFTTEQLPDHIPTLKQLFEKCGDQQNYSIDICDLRAIDQVHDVISRRGENFTKKSGYVILTLICCVTGVSGFPLCNLSIQSGSQELPKDQSAVVRI